MSEIQTGDAGRSADIREGGNAAVLGFASWLSLAAAPTFAFMALLTDVLGGGPMDAICSAAPDAFPLSAMALMYLLMSVFHVAPWMKLIASRRHGSARPCRTAGGA